MPWAKHVYWVYGILLSDERKEAAPEIQERLRALGVETRPFFLGMHEQPVFRRMGLFLFDSHPVAERLARRGFYIPNGLSLSAAEMEKVIAAVREVLQ
jgi:perosamine synthetase